VSLMMRRSMSGAKAAPSHLLKAKAPPTQRAVSLTLSQTLIAFPSVSVRLKLPSIAMH